MIPIAVGMRVKFKFGISRGLVVASQSPLWGGIPDYFFVTWDGNGFMSDGWYSAEDLEVIQ